MPGWARIVMTIAVARVAAALVLYTSGLSPFNFRPIPLWVFASLGATFSLVGLALALGNKNDRRAAWLGGILALVSCPLTIPLVVGGPRDALEWLVAVRPESFFGAFVWEFVACFPVDLRGRAARIARGIAAAGAATGAYLAAASLLAVLPLRGSPAGLRAIVETPSTLFWPVLLAIAVPAFGVLLWRSRSSDREARRRIQLFVGALAVGLLPFALEVLGEGLWPAYSAFVHRPPLERWVGVLLFGTLATLPLMTAYSVLFDHVVSVRIVLRKALQYALARYTIVVITLIPLGGLVLFMVNRRNEPMEAVLAQGSRPLVLLALAALGAIALRLRPRMLLALDRRYFREPYDAARILARLVGGSPADAAECGLRLSRELGQAFHANIAVFLADADGAVLHHTEGRLQPLSVMTPLLALSSGPEELVDVTSVEARAAVAQLPDHERRWLSDGGFSLIAPMRGHGPAPAGLLALSPKLSDLPYTEEDRRFLAAVASAGGLAFGHLRERTNPAAGDPPARECQRCFSLHPPASKDCLCGGPLIDAAVPHVLRGVFRFEQRIARGSMGAVYRAVDLSLGRTVAMKALANVSGDRASALVREARAMARVTHPNLATIYGVETWGGTVFLVQEYLEHGTLMQRLGRERLALDDAIDLGVTLTDLLAHLHRAHLVHCDIKPSNIGYTAGGVVKLFDFGLATKAGAAPSEGHLLGTPFYMSPEAIAGQPPSPSFDLWALAVVLYEVIAGRRPFDGPSTPDVLGAVLRGRVPPLAAAGVGSGGLDTLFQGALNRDPARRPATAAELGDLLLQLRSLHHPTGLPRGTHTMSET